MAVIYLRHDVHGTKVACSESEAAADCANGWQRFSIDAPVVSGDSVNAFVPAVADIDQLRAKYQDKFGVKPHHRKLAETLAAELGNG